MREYDDYMEDLANEDYANELLNNRFKGLISCLVEAVYSLQFNYDEMELEEIIAGLADEVGVALPPNGMKWQLKPSKELEMAKFMIMGV